MDCSVGLYVGEVCHRNVYGEVCKYITLVSGFSDEDKKLLF